LALLGRLMISGAIVFLLAGCTSTLPTPNTTPLLSEEDYLNQVASDWAAALGVEDPPEVRMVRYIFAEERDATLRSCLEGEGYSLDNSGLYSVPPNQAEAFATAQYVCAVRYPVDQRYAQPWTSDQVRIQYAWTNRFVVPCLEAQGYSIGDPPSEGTFVDTWSSDPWYPFAQVRLNVSAERFNVEWAKLEATCLQIAPSQVLWDSMTIDEWLRLHPSS